MRDLQVLLLALLLHVHQWNCYMGLTLRTSANGNNFMCRGKAAAVYRRCGVIPKVNYRSVHSEAAFGEIPWQVAIMDASSQQFVCSGVLVDASTVLTSRKCMINVLIENIRIRIGEWDLMNDNKEECFKSDEIPVIKKYTIKEQKLHKNKVHSQINSHIVYLKLKRPVDFDLHPHVAPACISMRTISSLPDLKNCFVAGWSDSQVHILKTPGRMPNTRDNILKKTNYEMKTRVTTTPIPTTAAAATTTTTTPTPTTTATSEIQAEDQNSESENENYEDESELTLMGSENYREDESESLMDNKKYFEQSLYPSIVYAMPMMTQRRKEWDEAAEKWKNENTKRDREKAEFPELMEECEERKTQREFDTKHGNTILTQILSKAAVHLASRKECSAKLLSNQFCVYGLERSESCKADIGSAVVCEAEPISTINDGEHNSEGNVLQKTALQESDTCIPQWEVIGIVTHSYSCDMFLGSKSPPVIAETMVSIMEQMC